MKVLSWLRRRLAYKLLVLMLLVGAVPYLSLLFYSEAYGEKELARSVTALQQAQMQRIHTELRSHVSMLEKELSFLADVGVMDDIVVHDLDQRIEQLLHSYKNHVDYAMDLVVLGNEETVVSSTGKDTIGQPYRYAQAFRSAIGTARPIVVDGKLLLFTPVVALFDRRRTLGYLVMEYAVDNFASFNLSDEKIASALIDPETGIGVGFSKLGISVKRLSESDGSFSTGRYLVLYHRIDDVLPGWYLVFRIDKQAAFSFLSRLRNYLWFGLVGGLLLIAAVSLWLSRRVSAPLSALERSVVSMTASGRYGLPIRVKSHDEIGRLAEVFNTMSGQIQKAIGKLEAENRLRTRRLTQMITLFNRLLHTQTEHGCIEAALEEIGRIVPDRAVRFVKNETDTVMPSLYVHDFEHDTLRYYGSLQIPVKGLSKEETVFFRALAAMIASRIDQLRAFARLKDDSEAKSSFISMLSHDLRTPLHAILAQTQYLIAYEGMSEMQYEKIGGIETAAQQLLGMINDLLDMAKLDAGKFEASLQTLAADEIVRIVTEVVEMLEPLAEAKGLVLSMEAFERSGTVVADAQLFRRIAVNMLSNALKFTDEGSVAVRMSRQEARIVLEVSDTGCGIDAALLPRIFDRFVQGSSAAGGRIAGSGLGLAMSRSFARLFGAEMEISSGGAGKGTTVRLLFTTL